MGAVMTKFFKARSGLLVLVFSICFSQLSSAQPDKDWWACQVTEDAGLFWQNNSWKVGDFKVESRHFVLISDGQGLLSKESVGKAMDIGANSIVCVGDGLIFCLNTVVGSSLSFSPYTSSGAITTTFGALLSNSVQKDSLHIQTFECAKG